MFKATLKPVVCAVLLATAGASFAAAALPEPVRVPAGHSAFLESVGVGEITYECREKKDMAGAFEWAFVAPVAVLNDMQKKTHR